MARVRNAVGGRRAFVKDESAFVRRAAAFERFLVDAEFAPTADERLFVLREKVRVVYQYPCLIDAEKWVCGMFRFSKCFIVFVSCV